MGKKRTTVQFLQFRLDRAELTSIYKLVGCEWSKAEEDQWREIIEGKRQHFAYGQDFTDKWKQFITKEAPTLRQTKLFDLSKIETIDPESIPEPILKKLIQKVGLHYEVKEVRAMRRLNTLESQILKDAKEIDKQEEQLKLLGITLKDVERIGKLIKDEDRLRDSVNLLQKKNRNLENRLSEARIKIYQELEIYDYMMQYSKPQRAWLFDQFEKYMLDKYGAPYTAMPRRGSALKIITKENLESHQRRRLDKEEFPKGED